jgi:hypothetical protein
VSAATLLSATSSWLMAHLRLFRPHRGTQSLGFLDHDFSDHANLRRVYRANAELFSNWKMSSRPQNVRVWPAATARDIGLE